MSPFLAETIDKPRLGSYVIGINSIYETSSGVMNYERQENGK
jgi:hypothetical protein